MTVHDSLHSLLDQERLLCHCDEWRTTNHCSHIERRLSDESLLQSQSHIATDGQSVSKSWRPGAHAQIFITFWQLRSCFLWGPLSDERTDLSFVYAAGPCQRSLSWIWVLWDSRPCFTLSDLRLSFSSPPATRRVTVEVFDPAPHGEYHS
jgi:hypothetical protein